MMCCPYHRDGGNPALGCVNPFSQQPVQKPGAIHVGDHIPIPTCALGHHLCPCVYTTEESVEILRNMSLNTTLSEAERHVLGTAVSAVSERSQIAKEIQDALLSELFPATRGELFSKMDDLKNKLQRPK